MINNHSPPSSTPLEPCRVVPYMNVPALRGLTLTPGSVAFSNYERLSAAAAAATTPFSQQGTAFSAINSAFISAAHQVSLLSFYDEYYRIFLNKNFSMPPPLQLLVVVVHRQVFYVIHNIRWSLQHLLWHIKILVLLI